MTYVIVAVEWKHPLKAENYYKKNQNIGRGELVNALLSILRFTHKNMNI